MEVRWISFPERKNETGALTFLEGTRHIPFEIKRVYYIYDVAKGARRGFHAHKKLEQVLVCVHGSCQVLLDDGKEQVTVKLDNPSKGLYLGNHIWREMFCFSSDAVLLVFASEYYEEADYIRSYEKYLQYLHQLEEKQ